MDNARDYKARVEYAVNDATQTVYSFSFPYLRKKFVMAYVIHADDTITNLQYGVDYTVNNFELTLTVPLKENEHLVIYRQTTTKNIIQWNDGSILLSKDMNVSDIQQLHLQEEHDDFARANNMFVSSKNFELTWDALGHRITNVKDPKDSSDVVTKHYMESVQDGFIQQNTALVNTATEDAGSAKDSSDIAKKWAMSPVSPDGVVDTNSPTGYTQSAKIWAALSKEYAGLSKFKLPIGYYNSVDEMRKSETALVGRPCVTLGYYEPNDGGGAVFIIRQKKESDVDDGGSVIFLNNGNVAELITKGTVNVKQFGAKGDELTDDTKSIDAAIHACLKESEWKVLDGGWTPPKLIIPHGRYKITKPIYLTASIANWYVDMQNSIILYDGPDYAIEIWGLRYCTVLVGGVKAPNGGCIKFSHAGANSWYDYLHLHFNWLEAKTDCILVDNTKDGLWGNEVYVHGGRLVSGKYGFRFENDTHGQGGGEHWAFYNVGFESPEIGIGLHAVSTDIQWFSFYFCRHNEMVMADRVLLETTGKVHDIFWIDTQPLRNSSFNLSPETYALHILPNYMQQLVDGTDLDTLNNPGTYICETNKSADTMINCPTYESFRLRIECLNNNNYYAKRQTIEIYNKNVTYVRYRPDYGKPWGSWIKMDTNIYNIELTPVHGHFVSYTCKKINGVVYVNGCFVTDEAIPEHTTIIEGLPLTTTDVFVPCLDIDNQVVLTGVKNYKKNTFSLYKGTSAGKKFTFNFSFIEGA